MSDNVMGIDIGNRGAIAVLSSAGELAEGGSQ
jgi:hypothetical protein